MKYFNDEGIDLDGQKKEDIAAAEEVFEIGGGRYLIVERAEETAGKENKGGEEI